MVQTNQLNEVQIQPWQKKSVSKNAHGAMNGKTVIGPNSSEGRQSAINLRGGSDSPVKITVAQKETKLPNLWDGGYNIAQPGDAIMEYGPQPAEYTHPQWQQYAKENGLTELVDKNLSVKSAKKAAIEEAYVDNATGKYLTGRLTDDFTGEIIAHKRAKTGTGFAIVPEGTPVLSTEAMAQGKSPVLSKKFQAVAFDSEGAYLTPLKTLKKYQGNNPVEKKFRASVDKALKKGDKNAWDTLVKEFKTLSLEAKKFRLKTVLKMVKKIR